MSLSFIEDIDAYTLDDATSIIFSSAPRYEVNGNTTWYMYSDVCAFRNHLNELLSVQSLSLVVEDAVAHETQHMRALSMIPKAKAWYSLGVESHADNNGFDVIPSITIVNSVLSRLALASVLAAPIIPSESDLSDLDQLGYDGPADVYNRVLGWNKQHPKRLLYVPLSQR